MKTHDATEQAYKNGYSKGFEDGKRGAVEVVRCRQCKHWKDGINACTDEKKFCEIGFYMIGKDGFCSFGEKKVAK